MQLSREDEEAARLPRAPRELIHLRLLVQLLVLALCHDAVVGCQYFDVFGAVLLDGGKRLLPFGVRRTRPPQLSRGRLRGSVVTVAVDGKGDEAVDLPVALEAFRLEQVEIRRAGRRLALRCGSGFRDVAVIDAGQHVEEQINR